MKHIFTIFIFLCISIAFSFNLKAQITESGWIESGNIKYQKFNTDTISFLKLSITGDTIYTLDNSGLHFWDFNTGKLLFEKKSFVRPPHLSYDMRCYTYIDYPQKFGPVFVEIYDLYTDSLIKRFQAYYNEVSGLDFYPDPANFDSERNILILSYLFHLDQAYTRTTELRTLSFKITNDSVKSISYVGTFPYNFSADNSKLAYYSYYETSNSHYKTSSQSSSVGYYDINQLMTVPLISNSNYREFGESKFTNLADRFAIIMWHDIVYWDLKTKTALDTIHFDYNIKYQDYLFVGNDNYLAYSTNKIYFKDVLSKTDIDSVSFLDSTKIICMDYNIKNKRFVFTNDNKLCIYNSDYFNNPEKVFFTSDSDYVYTTKQIRFHNKSTIEYDSLRWYLSDGQTSTEDQPVFTFNTPQKISVTLKIFKDNKTFKTTKNDFIEVILLLKADFTADTTYSTTSPLTVHFRNLSHGNVDTNEWNFGSEYQIYTYEKDPIYTFTKPGRYNIKLTVKDSKSKDIIIKNMYITVGVTRYYEIETENLAIYNAGKFIIENKNYNNSICFLGTNIIDTNIYSAFIEYETYYRWSMHRYLKYDNNLNLLNQSNYEDLGYNAVSQIYYSDTIGFLHTIDSKNIRLIDYQIEKSVVLNTELQRALNDTKINFFNREFFLLSGNESDTTAKVYKLNYDMKIIDSIQLKCQIIDMIKYIDKKNYLLIKVNSDKQYSFIVLSDSLKTVNQFKLNLSESISINHIMKFKNNSIGFCGANSQNGFAVCGAFDYKGNLTWFNEYKDWNNFTYLVINDNNFFVYGKSTENYLGFMEIQQSGEESRDNRIAGYFEPGILDIDVLDSNHLILSSLLIPGNNSTSSARYYKINYQPLTQKFSIPLDSTDERIPDTVSKHEIIFFPNPSEDFIDATLSEKAVLYNYSIYDVSGIEVKRVDLNAQKINSFKIDVRDFASGLFFIKINTEKGQIISKIIKY